MLTDSVDKAILVDVSDIYNQSQMTNAVGLPSVRIFYRSLIWKVDGVTVGINFSCIQIYVNIRNDSFVNLE